jgi:ribosomal protein L34E
VSEWKPNVERCHICGDPVEARQRLRLAWEQMPESLKALVRPYFLLSESSPEPPPDVSKEAEG